MASKGLTHKSRSRQASGLLAGTNPSKVAARLSLADLLLTVLLGTGTSVSSSTDAITAAAVALVRAFITGCNALICTCIKNRSPEGANYEVICPRAVTCVCSLDLNLDLSITMS